jgi:flavin-dependent dehydrogenase
MTSMSAGPHQSRDELQLVEPAGSFVSYFLLEMAERSGLELDVEIFEPRDFACVAPKGCNMCGGIISETLVQNLAAEGIKLPATIVQRGIESYMLHMDVGSVRIETPVQEKRIGAVYRGAGPRDLKASKWGSFDHHLEQLTVAKGARVRRNRVVDVSIDSGRPVVTAKGEQPQHYDLLVVAVGVNSAALKLFGENGLGYKPPAATKTFITEYYLGEEVIERTLGDSMHVFLLNIPRLEFAAIIPKGDYASVCLLGESIDKGLVQSFLDAPQVRACMPDNWTSDPRSCQCSPKISIGAAIKPYADRLVFVGDCGVTRLYKDGIGAAYRTAKACATTAVFEGISEADFRRHYWPVCRSISTDNSIGKLSFAVTRQIQKWHFARRALLRMTEKEQQSDKRRRDMSQVLWDMFTGSAPYRDIVTLAMHPRFLARFGWELVVAASPFSRAEI